MLCILTFIGRGYTPTFVERFHGLVDRIAKGAEIIVAEGIDDLCAALHNGDEPVCESGGHCLERDTAARDHIALTAVASALNLPLQIGATLRLDPARIILLRRLFADGTLREACVNCPWHGLCTSIADDGFKEVRLMPQNVPLVMENT